MNNPTFFLATLAVFVISDAARGDRPLDGAGDCEMAGDAPINRRVQDAGSLVSVAIEAASGQHKYYSARPTEFWSKQQDPRCRVAIQSLSPVDGEVIAWNWGTPGGFECQFTIAEDQLPSPVAFQGFLICRNLTTGQVWQNIVPGGKVSQEPAVTSKRSGLRISGWPLPVGDYEVGVILFIQERPRGPVSLGDFKSHHFLVVPSTSEDDIVREIENLRSGPVEGDIVPLDEKVRFLLMKSETTPRVWEAVASLQKLSKLHLSGLQISGAASLTLSELPALTELDLADALVSADAARVMAPVLSIRRLDLSRTTIPKVGQAALFASPHLEVLHFQSQQVSDADLRLISKLSKLAELNLSRCDFRMGISSGCLSQLPVLCKLDLAESSVTDHEMKEIALCAKLEQLDLSGTIVGDDGLNSLRNHKALCRLNLLHTCVTRDGTEVLLSLKNLQEVTIDERLAGASEIESLRMKGVEVHVIKIALDGFDLIWRDWKMR